MKKLLIILLLISSTSFAKTPTEKAREDCKNWKDLETRPQKEVIKCFKSYIERSEHLILTNREDIETIFAIQFIYDEVN
jgi:hypothetical protein